MRKICLVGILVCFLFLGLSTAQAERWNLGGSLGTYSPNFGDGLKEINNEWGTDLKFNGGPIPSLTLSYNLTNETDNKFVSCLRLRLEIGSFSTESESSRMLSDGYWFWDWCSWDWRHYYWEEILLAKAELKVTPLMISLIYMFPSFDLGYSSGSMHLIRPYIGVGIGQFPTELTITADFTKTHYVDGKSFCTEKSPIKDGDIANPTGFQVFCGLEGELNERISLAAEIKYPISKAVLELKELKKKIEIDWGGLEVSALIMLKI